MKWIVFLIILVHCNLNAIATTISTDPKQSAPTTSKFIQRLNTSLQFKNLDSIEKIFSQFVTEKITTNQLTEGHSALNQIIANQTLSDTLKILAYKNKAILFGQIDYSKKRKAFEAAIKVIQANGILMDLRPMYDVEIAKTYLSQSNYLGATKTLKKVNISLIQNAEKKVEILGICGFLYAEMNDTIQAVNKLNEAISIATQNKDYFGIGAISSTMARIYSTKFKQKQKAISHYRNSMNAFHKAGYDHYALGSQCDIGVTYSHLNKLDSALYYLEKSYDESISIGSTYDQSICANELGIVYNKLNKPQLALKMCYEAKKLNWDNSSHRFRSSCALCLSKAYESLNEYDSSLYYYKLYDVYSDSTLNLEETKAIAKYNAEVEKQVFVLEQEKMNLKKDQVLKTRNLYIIFLSIFMLLIIGIFLLIIRGNKNRKKRELIEHEEKSQRVFSQQLLQFQEDEKVRISRELHDSVGQDLILLKNKAHSIQDTDLESHVASTLNNVRRITQGLHPFVLEQFGLTTALKKLIETVDQNSTVFISEEIENIDDLLTKQQELGVYRIVQEAINNILKHSESPSALIVAKKENTSVILSLKDYGKGFDWSAQSKMKNSLGMKTLEERAKILNAEFNIDSKLNKGTTINLKIPIKDA